MNYLDNIANIDDNGAVSRNNRDPMSILTDLEASHSILENKGDAVAIFMLCDPNILILTSWEVTQRRHEIPAPVMVESLQEIRREP